MKKTIGSYMVKSPYVGLADSSLLEALELLVECGIRHLPIVEQGRLIGLVSERDLRAAMALPQAHQLFIRDIMKEDVYVAEKSTPLRDVLRTMQRRKLGSTVIINDQEEVLGIFTVIDALRILADILSDEEDGERALIGDFFQAWNLMAMS